MTKNLISIVAGVANDARMLVQTSELIRLRLREDLGLDSLQLAVLTVKIEAEFGVDVFADGVVTTVGEIEEKIWRHQAETGASNPGGDVTSDQGIGDTTGDGSTDREQAGDDPVEREQSGE